VTVRISVEEAVTLLGEGYVYLDVRSEPEFEQGHAPGALNVPLLHQGPAGLTANPEFQAVMEAAFAKDEKLLVACKAGGRSLKAAALLEAAGYTNVREMRAGWDGGKDAFGRPEPGWSKKGLPVEAGLPAGQRYADVKQRAR
jgi:rhodanese-related sulfurtransferase